VNRTGFTRRAFVPTLSHNRAYLIVALAAAVGCGLAQETSKDKHVRDIKAEQPESAILASPLCQHVQASEEAFVLHAHEVDSGTLEPDLASLMKESDEVILASYELDTATVLAPSGEDVVHYSDVKVMRTWKGDLKVGDVLTFAIPIGEIRCLPLPQGFHQASFETQVKNLAWKGQYPGPYILFLRQTHGGTEEQQATGLRLTAGGGLQGLFDLYPPSSQYRDADKCAGVGDRVAKCNAWLNESKNPVHIPYRGDPLVKKYEGMPISTFLKEVQTTAESLGYVSQSDTK
jgi:hypothetical protein